MDGILQIVADKIDLVIIVFGVVLTAVIFVNGAKLSSHKSRIDEAVSRRNRKWGLNPVDGSVVDEDDEDASITPDTIRQYEREFNKDCAVHSACSQLITIFPLLGIFGTVVALMHEAEASSLEQMMSHINTALSSTFCGLIFAIPLKAIDAVFPSRLIEDVEATLDDYSKKLDLADMIQKIKNND